MLALTSTLALVMAAAFPSSATFAQEAQHLRWIEVPEGPLDEAVYLHDGTGSWAIGQRIDPDTAAFFADEVPGADAESLPPYTAAPVPNGGTPFDPGGMTTHAESGRVEFRSLGSPVAAYVFDDGPRPYVHPLLAPDGVAMTRGYPIAESREGEAHDHPHHRSMWFAHGDINGIDFWHDPEARIRMRGTPELTEGSVFASLRARHDWISPEGTLVATDTTTLRVYGPLGARMIEFEIELTASEGPLSFGDTKEGLFAVRLAPELRVRGEVAAGHLANSTGIVGKEVWGQRARWVSGWGSFGGAVRGVALLDHPHNLRHPTWWHARDYGLLAANPFGIHDFEGKAEATGEYRLAKGASLRLRYLVVIHGGDPEDAAIDRQWRAWSAGAGQ